MTAREIVDHERNELGNAIAVTEGLDLASIPAHRLAWLTEKSKDAREYGEVSRVTVSRYRIVARDRFGGVLLEQLPDEC